MKRYKLDIYIEQSWDYYKKVKGMTCVVKDVIPILWFGDSQLYEQGTMRIVTVGLNPSLREFEEGTEKGVAVRFPKAASLVGKNLSSTDVKTYTEAMDDYFKCNPLDWFGSYEKLLNNLDASYGGKNVEKHGEKERTAIHIDLYSSVATNPTWGGLCDVARSTLSASSKPDFTDLLDALCPHVVLISANKDIVTKYFGDNGWNAEKSISSKVAYVRHKKENGRIIIWGYNFRGTPFGGMKDCDLKNAFDNIRKIYGF